MQWKKLIKISYILYIKIPTTTHKIIESKFNINPAILHPSLVLLPIPRKNPIIDNKSPKFNSVTKIISVSQRSNTPRTINNSQKKTNNKRASKINKQLNLITKNIENTSKNINNPEQFYSRFFKSIINKNSQKPNSNKDNAVPNIKSDNKIKTNTNLFRYYMKSRGDLSVKNSYRRKNIDEWKCL